MRPFVWLKDGVTLLAYKAHAMNPTHADALAVCIKETGIHVQEPDKPQRHVPGTDIARIEFFKVAQG